MPTAQRSSSTCHAYRQGWAGQSHMHPCSGLLPALVYQVLPPVAHPGSPNPLSTWSPSLPDSPRVPPSPLLPGFSPSSKSPGVPPSHDSPRVPSHFPKFPGSPGQEGVPTPVPTFQLQARSPVLLLWKPLVSGVGREWPPPGTEGRGCEQPVCQQDLEEKYKSKDPPHPLVQGGCFTPSWSSATHNHTRTHTRTNTKGQAHTCTQIAHHTHTYIPGLGAGVPLPGML